MTEELFDRPGYAWVSEWFSLTRFTRVKTRWNWRYQRVLTGDYVNSKTKERKNNIVSYSKNRKTVDEEEMFNEAVRHAQGQLGGSNWKLVKIRRNRDPNKVVKGKVVTGSGSGRFVGKYLRHKYLKIKGPRP